MDVNLIRAVVSAIRSATPPDWNARDGVCCPVCGAELHPGRAGVLKTGGWSGNARERYHECPVCTARFKSVEETIPL